MDTIRYVVGVIFLLSLPPGFFLWFAIHPFARHWRKIGAFWTYAVLTPPCLLIMGAFYVARESLLSTDLGTSYLSITLAVVLAVGSAAIALKRKRHLSFGILSGVPELSQKQYPGKLLTEGIYGTIRHPRYVEVTLAIFAYASFVNYLGCYVAALLSLPVLYLIVVLEERELRERFGAEYEDYCRRVPRFFPRSPGN